MSTLSLDIPEYELATIHFISEVLQGFLDLDPLFQKIPREITMHRGPIRNVPGDSPLDQDMFPVTAEGTLSWDTIRNSNVDEYVSSLLNLSISQRKSLARQFFKNITTITDITGRSVDAKGKPL